MGVAPSGVVGGAGASNSTTKVTDSLSSLACACLVSLVVAWGETGKTLTAISALLMSPAFLTTQVGVSCLAEILSEGYHP